MQHEPQFWSPANRRSSLPEGARLRLFALCATELGAAIAQALGKPLAAHEERQFEDGEHKTRPLDTVGGMDVYVVQGLHGVLPKVPMTSFADFCFSLALSRTPGPHASRPSCHTSAMPGRIAAPSRTILASLFAAVGTDAIVTLEVHNPAAFENAFNCRTVALTAAPLFVGYDKALKRCCQASSCACQPQFQPAALVVRL